MKLVFQPGKRKLDLKNIGYLPRWIILGIDISILVFSAIVTYVLLQGLTLSFYTRLTRLEELLMVVGVNIVYFLLFRTYAGLIRYSSYIDGLKLLFSTFASFVTLAGISYTSYFITGEKLFLVPGLFMYFIISFAFLFLFRVVVKQVFHAFFGETRKEEKTKVLIFGADSNAISVANAIRTEQPVRFKILGFVDKSNHNTTKRILDLPILSKNKRISVLLRAHGAQGVILADKHLTKAEKIELVDDCLESGYKVFTAPLISDWENEQDFSRQIKNIQIEDLLERKPIVLDNKGISKELKGKRVLVTGAAGSIGSEIVRQVLKYNPELLIIVDQAETPLHQLRLELDNLSGKVQYETVIADVRNYERMNRVFEAFAPQMVYHAAAYKHVPLMEENPSEAVFVNIMGTKNMADLAIKYKTDKFVMVSTDKAVNPSNVMGASKRIAEMYVQSLYFSNKEKKKKTTRFITTRFGNVLGSNGSVVPLFKEQIAKGGPVTITHPDIIRYFMTIPEACRLVLEAGAMGKGGEIFIFDMGEAVKIMDLATKMIRLAGFIPQSDIEIKVTGLRPGEKLYEELLSDKAKTLPTHHEKIMIATETAEDYNCIHTAIQAIYNVAVEYRNDQTVKLMKELVPEYKSMNSLFEALDHQSDVQTSNTTPGEAESKTLFESKDSEVGFSG
ncbi:NDP-sugar epimerase, includes UDP-GlcNAc-inverting 4,6-dehydratase FlaA1 and capsular polysaccharide biosynthesis protein EpsC [Sinomicrobium oceani]|uniref:NDP-sugar epimerase, includes UDP-GlcNAc-inverting 4,6-dehydratase FlaA1 and capsular polysaccharide biosynthesis protein EpsC n=2 Tax=Sinomicrobium oceani TaxID=1150368 RepID=A0A1K1QZ82_9FLAO|nr:NDP-sugar epimerase, includes UDP-GlcNAc-inverting 4,6-dehydratase FlaA1 and capsular polysaccharide biosynthesis protein EpsC [Sinomicrobium oceani]